MSYIQYRNHKRNIIEVAQLNLLGNQCSSDENGLKMKKLDKNCNQSIFSRENLVDCIWRTQRWLQVKVPFFNTLYPFERSRLIKIRNVSLYNLEQLSSSFWDPQNRLIDKNSCWPDVYSFSVVKSSRMVIFLVGLYSEQLVALV